jgi:hypothetical protein
MTMGPKDRFASAADGLPLNHLCPSYRTYFTHGDRPMWVMAASLRAVASPTR